MGKLDYSKWDRIATDDDDEEEAVAAPPSWKLSLSTMPLSYRQQMEQEAEKCGLRLEEFIEGWNSHRSSEEATQWLNQKLKAAESQATTAQPRTGVDDGALQLEDDDTDELQLEANDDDDELQLEDNDDDDDDELQLEDNNDDADELQLEDNDDAADLQLEDNEEDDDELQLEDNDDEVHLEENGAGSPPPAPVQKTSAAAPRLPAKPPTQPPAKLPAQSPAKPPAQPQPRRPLDYSKWDMLDDDDDDESPAAPPGATMVMNVEVPNNCQPGQVFSASAGPGSQPVAIVVPAGAQPGDTIQAPMPPPGLPASQTPVMGILAPSAEMAASASALEAAALLASS